MNEKVVCKDFPKYCSVRMISAEYIDNDIYPDDLGCVVDNTLVDGCIKVDFSGVDEDDNYFGASMLIDVEHIELVDWEK